MFRCDAQMIVTNEVDGTFNTASYGTSPYRFWECYFATYFYDMYPQYTNHIYDTGRSGSSWNLDWSAQEFKWNAPLWHSFPVPGSDWVLANDNGGYDSNSTVQWGTNLFSAPPLYWNQTAVTNEGVTTPIITHYAMGRVPSDSPDGNSGAIDGNAASMYLDKLYGTPVVDMWHLLWTNGLSSDVTGARLFGFFPGGHPYPAGHLCMALKALIALGAETNIGVLTLDWAGARAFTNHCVASGISLGSNTLTTTVHFDRMPLAWDVPDGTITNDARNAFVLMPDLGSAFRWEIQVTNLPAGTYNLSVDGVLTDTASAAQLTIGRNWFTNYNGPLWAQRKAVLNAKRDQEGADHVTLLTHNAGQTGVINGAGDMVNFISYSGNSTEVYPSLYTGTNYLNYIQPLVDGLHQYDLAIHNAALQTNHVITISLSARKAIGPPTELHFTQ
jgi:hypothetical protein